MEEQYQNELMKAVVYTNYGSPDVLRLKEIPRPVPSDDEALIRVHAASLNYGDWGLLRGKPFFLRLVAGGLLTPEIKILGGDIAGQVEAVGRYVGKLYPGQQVFGDLSDCGRGGFAQYVCVAQDRLAAMPASIEFEEAAAVPMAAVVALQGLRDIGQIEPGKKNGYHAISDYLRALSPQRIYVCTGGSLAQIFQAMLFGKVMSRFGGKQMDNLAHKPNRNDLVFLKELFEAGTVVPVIDRRYLLDEVAEPFRCFGEGHSRGKVVITVEHD